MSVWNQTMNDSFVSEKLDEVSSRIPVGAEVSQLIGHYGAPARVLTGRHATALTPVDASGRRLFTLDAIYIWELAGDDFRLDVLTFGGRILEYQASGL